MDKIKSFDDQDWKNLVSEFKERVEKDKKLGIDSVFLPNPEICPNPDYILVGMEPSTPREDRINFFPLFLHYCAHKYLCRGEFKYYITDLGKGAMPTEVAKNTREKRYPVWLPLFEKEWELLGKPKIIVMSSEIYYKHIKGRFENKKDKDGGRPDYVLHYSTANCSHLITEYKKYILPQSNSYKLDEAEFKEFVDKLKDHLKRNEHLGPKYEAALNNSELMEETLNMPNNREIVFPLYSFDFEQVAKGKKIPHL